MFLQMIASQDFWRDQEPYMIRTIQDIWDSRQPSTIQKYCFSLRNFFAFSQMTGKEVTFPVQVPMAARYLAFLRDGGVSKSTIKVALVSLKWVNAFFPDKDNLESPFLGRMVESAQRNIPAKRMQI